jgi:hypothetical protein
MKLKQERKCSNHDDKGSCHNSEATFPSRKSGYDRHCHDLLRQILPRQRLLLYFLVLINPRRACAKRVTVVLCVCYCSNCHLYVENKVPLGFSWQCQRMYCVDFVEHALFKSSGDICWSPPFSPLDDLSVDETDSDQFISRLIVQVRRSSDSSYNSNESSLLTVDYQPLFLDFFFVCTKSADLACACYLGATTITWSSLVPRPFNWWAGRKREGLVSTACVCAVIIQILNNPITYGYFPVYLPFDLISRAQRT